MRNKHDEVREPVKWNFPHFFTGSLLMICGQCRIRLGFSFHFKDSGFFFLPIYGHGTVEEEKLVSNILLPFYMLRLKFIISCLSLSHFRPPASKYFKLKWFLVHQRPTLYQSRRTNPET